MSNFLNLIKYFLAKDMKARYAGSGLGILWTIILPLFQIVLYWFVFSTIMRVRPYADSQIPYSYFLISTFFFWLSIAESMTKSGSVIIENAELVKKVHFPKIVLPISITLSAYLHNMVGVIAFLAIFSFSGLAHSHLVFILPVAALQFVFSMGTGLLFAAVVPYVRDLQQIMGYLVQGMFFLSPVIYRLDAIPGDYRMLAFLNPVTVYIESYHTIIFEKQFPCLEYTLGMLFISAFSLFLGMKVFKKLNEGFADIL
jgi:ABC-type polysaccharide/polyol phosphate export permease